VPTPTYSVGQVLGAADCNNWFMPKVAYKASDTARASTTTPSADPDLTIPVAANAFYAFTCFVFFEGSSTASQGIKWNFAVPASTTVRYHGIFTDTAGIVSTGVAFIGTATPSAGTNGAGSLRGATLHGTCFTSSTTGNMVFQWSQNVSEASTVTLHAQSYMILHRMG
jgi:hypothetical protein